MKVTNYGFALGVENDHVSVEDVVDHLVAGSGAPDNSQNLERRIYVDKDVFDDFYCGLVVTVRDQKKFCTLEDTQGGVKVTVENLTGDDKLMEFNFFAINKNNEIGLYQHYFQSCSINIFGAYLKRAHHKVKINKIKEEEHFIEREGKAVDEKKRKEIRKKYKGVLNFDRLVRSEDLDKILEEYKRIKSFEYEYAALTPKIKKATPLSGYMKKKREKITFFQGADVGVLSKAIKDAVDVIKPKSGKVLVSDEYGDDEFVRIDDIPENFGEEDFDVIADKLNNLDLKVFYKNMVMDSLVSRFKEKDYKYILMAQVG